MDTDEKKVDAEARHNYLVEQYFVLVADFGSDIAREFMALVNDDRDDEAEAFLNKFYNKVSKVNKAPEVNETLVPTSQITPEIADELIKYKKLELDGIITPSEFETKKKQLLGI
jgi:hypothetical protein